ncbi:MAG: ArsR family transcriptional regulator [Candidatus Bathyarchaeota archaeon]|nr:ArsR family transcriptional regulator [Candidatus Bathyarchaeota archaeon]
MSKSEIRILRQLSKGKCSLSEIEKALSLKPALLSQNLKKLLKKGLIQTTGQGNRKFAYFNDTKHALLLRDLLITYDHIDWQNILTGRTLEILFQALTPEVHHANVSTATLWRHLKNLKARGIITQTGKEYKITPGFSILIEFLKEYQRFFAQKLAKALSEGAVILWQEDMEFLIRAPKNAKPPTKDFHKTATSKFQEYDLPLFSESDSYFYSKNKKQIQPEDVILHTLLIEPKNTRYTTYALLLLKKTEKQLDKNYLLQEAQTHGLKDQVNSMLQFLKTHTQQTDQALPTWNEFASKARDYNVVIA